MEFLKSCLKCPDSAHCCKFRNNFGFTFLTSSDARRIAKFSSKDISEFAQFSSISKKVVSILQNSDPALEGVLRFSQLDSKNRLFRLKTRENGDCIFLGKNGRCEVYGVRPNVCRIFPFWAMKLLNGKIKVIAHDTEPSCAIVKNLQKKFGDVEKGLTKNEVLGIKKTFARIRKE